MVVFRENRELRPRGEERHGIDAQSRGRVWIPKSKEKASRTAPYEHSDERCVSSVTISQNHAGDTTRNPGEILERPIAHSSDAP
jgi:hypothetical protein